MNFINLSIFSLIALQGVTQVNCIVDPFTLGVIGTAIGIFTFLNKQDPELKHKTLNYGMRILDKACQMVGACEGCEDYWIPANLQGLEYELKSEVFGQPLAVEMILSSLKSHLNNKNPRRSLVLSFHGSAGTGKNFVSNKILKNMFKKGEGTRYVKFFRGSSDFPLSSKVESYKTELLDTIREMVYECHRSVFVFDEVEKMPNGILEVIRSIVSTGKDGDYDYRRVIFILLSNVGSKELSVYALNAWKRGIERDDMNTNELTRLLTTAAYNSEGGLKHTGLIKNHDVTFFVPFLPLERTHIVQCLEHYVTVVKHQVMSPELTEQVLEEMIFIPEQKVFSSSGCKRVAEVADYLIERETSRKRRRPRK